VFLEDGARRFVFEGRECGGHVGPRSSFVLWESMIDTLQEAITQGWPPGCVAFAGGIRRAVGGGGGGDGGAARRAEVRIGVLVGTAYLVHRGGGAGGAIVDTFQQEAVRCARTVLMESGPGHAIRCADTPYYETFRELKRQLLARPAAGRGQAELEKMNLGRLRSPRRNRPPSPRTRRTGPVWCRWSPSSSGSTACSRSARRRSCASASPHRRAAREIARGHPGPRSVPGATRPEPVSAPAERPCDVAVVGAGCLLPGAHDVPTFWANLLSRVDPIREIPPDRFDHALYYDPDPSARDKIYSKWGGFIDDVAFDPVRYGIPPNALSSIDPLQLLALVAVDQAFEDAGYATREFDRERTSVIFGLSGGLGDLGCDYSVRAGLPQLVGEVPPELLERLPEWTEDSFAGLLLNVVAGRVANRFDLGELHRRRRLRLVVVGAGRRGAGAAGGLRATWS
jgi:hypothetical protein